MRLNRRTVMHGTGTNYHWRTATYDPRFVSSQSLIGILHICKIVVIWHISIILETASFGKLWRISRQTRKLLNSLRVWQCMLCMMTSSMCSALLALCAGNSPVTGEFPSRRPVAQSFEVFFDLRLNKRLSKQLRRQWFETPSRSLWRPCNILVTVLVALYMIST